MKLPKILFFVTGMAPTPEDIANAGEIKAHVCYRNALAVPAEGALEACDGVAGAVPAPYAGLPTSDEAVKAYAAKLKALKTKIPESPAPIAPPSNPASSTKAAKDAASTSTAAAGAGDTDKPDPNAPPGHTGGAWSKAV